MSKRKRRFSIRQVGRGRPGPGTVYEVLVRLTDPVTGNDGPFTRAEAQRHADWLNYAEECFYAGLPVPPPPISSDEVLEVDLREFERRAAVDGARRPLPFGNLVVTTDH